MAIRKLLLPLQAATTAEVAFSTAALVAKLWCAHVAVLHVTTDNSDARAMREVFEKLAVKNGLPVAEATPNADHPTTSFTAIVGRESEVVAYQARLADLVVVPHPASPAETTSSDALHAVLFESAQPVLIAPRIEPATIGTRICLGWNGSAESASAVLAASPWLNRTQAIRILWSESYQRRGPRAQELQAYLGEHDFDTDVASFRPIENIVGAGLLAAAGEFGCDLLVVGAYSHSRLRQLILGGVTRHVLEHAAVPLIMHR